jgi:alkaline phosphatase
MSLHCVVKKTETFVKKGKLWRGFVLLAVCFWGRMEDGILSAQSNGDVARNVILVIGDGMGLGQLSYLSYSLDAPVALESFPVIGFQKTHSASHLNTDSGAAATAMSCGIKTYNNAIGVNPDTAQCTTLFEIARQMGKRTGVVVTSSLVHATPAAFIAHQSLRGFYEEIAEDLVNHEVDYIVGGGQMYFKNRFSDDRDLVEELKSRGYTVSGYDRKSFASFAHQVDQRMAFFISHSEPLPRMQGREPLDEFVRHALKVLSSMGNGFFLMIEGAQVDFAAHGNHQGYLLSEMKDLDAGIRAVLEFASGRDDTLVIVTGDHESGGLSLRESKPDKKVHVEFLTRNHTCTMVPVFAYGPGAQSFSGIYENTEIFHKIVAAAGYQLR